MMLHMRANCLGARPAAAKRGALVRRSAGAQVVTAERPVMVVAQTGNDDGPDIIELDVDLLQKRIEAKAKALIAMEEAEIKTRTKVKFVLPVKIGLGEAWKIVGKLPELGNFVPEVAPYMQWNNGDVWTLETPMRAGKFYYKAVLKKPDGAYVWEEGKDREIEVPHNGGVKEVKIDHIKFPPA